RGVGERRGEERRGEERRGHVRLGRGGPRPHHTIRPPAWRDEDGPNPIPHRIQPPPPCHSHRTHSQTPTKEAHNLAQSIQQPCKVCHACYPPLAFSVQLCFC